MVNAIEVSNLTKYYGQLLAVNQITFTVSKGEIFGLLGPNGAGKTTTIKILSCLLRPNNGSATIAGYDVIQDSRQVRKTIGVVPEQSNLYNELTAWDNLMFMTQLYGVPRKNRTQTVHELLKMFGLDEHSHKRFAALSKGLKRRLTIAAGLVHDPQILFLDEPTVGLDVASARVIRQLITTLKERGVTVVLTSHYIEEVDQLCDCVAILDKGQITTIDSPMALKARVQTTVTLEVVVNQGGERLKEELERKKLGQVVKIQNILRILTERLPPVLEFINDFVKEHKLEVQSINTVTPTLEDAFVQITGVNLEKMQTEKGNQW